MQTQTQAELWNDANAKRWAKLRPVLAGMLSPFGDAAVEALKPRRGELALDVGCGFGDTTVELARRTGKALGIDVSAPMIETARREARDGARYLLADAQTARLDERFDLVYSRFGIMFFEDPAAAFANLYKMANPGARFSAAVWGPFEENTWAAAPLRVLRRHVPGPLGPQPGPGPFSLADAAHTTALLERAGFSQVSVTPVRRHERTEPALLLQSGPSATVLRESGLPMTPELEAEVARELPNGIDAVGLVITAVRP